MMTTPTLSAPKVIVCGKDGCDKPSSRPEDYAPLCSKHYIEAIKDAEKLASANFQAHITTLMAKPMTEGV